MVRYPRGRRPANRPHVRRAGGALRIGTLLALAGAGCGIFDPDERRVVGIIDTTEARPSVPDSAPAGDTFQVAVTTVFSPCGWLRSETEVETAGTIASVIPYEVFEELDEGVLCPGVLTTAEHRATVSFPAAGAATVVFRGRDWDDTPVELPYPVTVY